MSGQDRGAELVSAMLERRVADAPPWLRDRIAAEASRTPQAGSPRRLDRLRAPFLVVVLMAIVAGGGYVAGLQGQVGSAAQPPASGAGASSAANAGSLGPSAQAPSDQPQETLPVSTAAVSLPVPPTAPPSLTVGALAVVTPSGDGLRVRTQPGVTDNSTRLQPLLPSGTRMLILRGPVTLDNHDWYEVSIDGTPSFGWVASAGGSTAWLAPAAPRCSGSRAPAEAWTVPAIDLVACYGAQPYAVEAIGTAAGQDTFCAGATGGRGCTPDPRWLLQPQTVTVRSDAAGGTTTLAVAVPESLTSLLATSSPSLPLGIMIALDHPAAQACRVVDKAGLDLIARDAAVATCRLTFVVVAVTN